MASDVRKSLAILAATLFVVASAASARAADELITEFTKENVSEILTAAGAKEFTASKDSAGNQVLIAKFDDGPIIVTFVECKDAPPCRGIQLAMYFDKLGDTFNAGFANNFNLKWLSATAIVEKDGSLTLADYLICNGGITKQNVSENVALFMRAPAALALEIRENTLVSYRPDGAQTSSDRDRRMERASPPAHAKADRDLLRRHLPGPLTVR